MNKKAKKLALAGMIAIKAKESALLGIDNFGFSAPKTKEAIEVLKNIGAANAKVLVVLNSKEENTTKSLNNIPSVKYVSVGYLNPFDILSADKIVFEQAALESINTK
jgi:large subunit ribosomal protein L4